LISEPLAVSPPLGPRPAPDPLHHLDDLGPRGWPEVKPLLRRPLEMRRQIAREGWWNYVNQREDTMITILFYMTAPPRRFEVPAPTWQGVSGSPA